MATKKQRAAGTWEYRFTRKGLLLKPVYKTFATEVEGDIYAAQAEALFDRGIIPPDMVSGSINTIAQLLALYEESEALAPSSSGLIPALRTTIGGTKLQAIDNEWLDKWIKSMQQTLAPSTLKKRVELLARCTDWGMRKNLMPFLNNPMRLLPRGWSTKGMDRAVDWSGQRERRLSADGAEERAIRSVLAEKGSPAELMLFEMALESAMRSREMYTLTVDQIRFDQETIFLEKTKNGSKRQVPMSSTLKKSLSEYMKTIEGDKLFPWWDGTLTVEYLDALSSRMSQRFSYRFAQAGCPDFRFHDLRHEATSRIYEKTTMSDMEIASITGHKGLRMLQRYANLRGSNLAKKMWSVVFATMAFGCAGFAQQAFVNVTWV